MQMFLVSLLVLLVLVSAFISHRFCDHQHTSLASYLSLIAHVRKILARAQKKSYTISVGKLNPAKLANFMEIECFILIACPENSVIDAKVCLSCPSQRIAHFL
jgi:hypothetical protein